MRTEVARPGAPGGEPTAGPASRPRSLLRRAAGAVPTLLVAGALVAVGYWGHETGWTFTHRRAEAPADAAPGTEGVAVVRFGRVVDDRLPPAVRRAAALEFPSAEAVERAGIDVMPAGRAGITDAVTASGELSFDPARVARLSARSPGTVRRVLATVGQPVKAGEVLALVDAVEVGRAKAEVQQALVQARLRRAALEQLDAAGAGVPEARRQTAEAAVKEADVRLLGAVQALNNLGFGVAVADFDRLSLEDVARRLRLAGVPQGLDGLAPDTASANLLPVKAPRAGVVLSADVVGGEVVDAARVLFVVVDPTRVRLTLHVAPDDVRRVKLAQAVRFRPDGAGEEAVGAVNWIGTAADEVTRTIPVRAELANDAGRLRASTLGRGRVVIREAPNALVVPADAVHRVGGTPVVFVRDKDYLAPDGRKAFHLRPVTTGASDGPGVEVTAGLSDGEVVATKGSRLLVAELEQQANRSGGR